MNCLKLLTMSLVLSLALGSAAAISYTVQVVALADQDAALALQRQLLGEGYPVYLVGVQTDNGPVYRLRVGSFANRAAAASFAAAMGNIAGSAPAPALTEGIPGGLIPLEPELITSHPLGGDDASAAIVPWSDGFALRHQRYHAAVPLEAEYRVLTEPLVRRPFVAWRAVPDPGTDTESVLRVRSFELWPTMYADLSYEERERHENERLLALSASFDAGPGELRRHVYEGPSGGVPYIVLVERLSLATGEQSRLQALGKPADSIEPMGPELAWLADAPGGVAEALAGARSQPTNMVDVDLALANGDQGSGTTLEGRGWTASADGNYTRLRLVTANRSWRAVAGAPVWAHEQFLLVIDQDELKLYLLLER